MPTPLLKERIVVTSDCDKEVEKEVKEKIQQAVQIVVDQCSNEYLRSIKATIQIEVN